MAESKENQKAGNSKKGDRELYGYYIELESPLDLARYSLDYHGSHIKAIRYGDAYRLFSMGEKVGDIRILYYVTSEKLSNFMVYKPWSDYGEKLEMSESITEQMDYKSYRAPIVEILSNPYIETTDFKKVGRIIKIEVKDPNTLVKSLAGYSHDEDQLPRLYCFKIDSNRVIGTFDLFHESGVKIFAYAKIPSDKRFGAIVYNYLTDTIEPVISFTEKAAIYIKVINLKNPFPFF